MPFFHEEKYQKPIIKRIDLSWANQLRIICTTKLGRCQQWSLTRWADDFRKMRKMDLIPSQTIQAVLDWYEEHAQRIPNPQILNARHFRSAFGWLERKWLRYEKESIVVSPEASAIFVNLKDMGWPKGSVVELPAAIQLTLDAFLSFRAKIRNYAQLNPEWTKKGKRKVRASKEVVFAHYLNNGGFPQPAWLTEQWFRRVHDRVTNWENWSGNIVSAAWNGSLWDREFRKIALGWASYSTDRELWNNFSDAINRF